MYNISNCLTANPATALQPGVFWWFTFIVFWASWYCGICVLQNDTQGLRTSRAMDLARFLWWFIFIEFQAPWKCWIYCGGGQECRNDIQGFQNSRKLTQPGWFEDSFSLNFALPGHHFGGSKGCQNDAQGIQKDAKMMPGEPRSQGKCTQGHPKGVQREQERKNIENMASPPLDLDTHFDTFSPKDEQKWQRDDFLGGSRANSHFQ